MPTNGPVMVHPLTQNTGRATNVRPRAYPLTARGPAMVHPLTQIDRESAPDTAQSTVPRTPLYTFFGKVGARYRHTGRSLSLTL